MPVFSITLRAGQCTKHTVRLRRGLKLHFLKLLHFYHNIQTETLSPTSNTTHQRLLFAKFSCLGLDQYENVSTDDGHGSTALITLGGTGITQKGAIGEVVARDLYKVLVDTPGFAIDQAFTIEMFYMDSKGVMQPLDSTHYKFVDEGSDGMTFANFVFEYSEM